MIPDIRLDRPSEYVTGCVTDQTKEKPFINFVLLHVWTCLHLLQPFKEEWQNREKIEIYMATLSSTPYIVFPVLLFLLLLSISFLSPINQNPDLRFHPSSSSTPNHSQTKHQTPEASSFLGNVSTHGIPSTSTTTVVGGLTITLIAPSTAAVLLRLILLFFFCVSCRKRWVLWRELNVVWQVHERQYVKQFVQAIILHKRKKISSLEELFTEIHTHFIS